MSSAVRDALREHLGFTLRLQGALGEGGTLCWSPYSVAAALGVAAAGAAGQSRQQLLDALTGGGEPAGLAELLSSAALDTSSSESGALFRVSTTLWADERAHARPGCAEQLTAWPGGQLRSQALAAAPEAARETINADVARTTNGLIRQALGPGAIGAGTAALLVSALYLKLAWVSSFPERDTVDAPFHAPAGTADVPTMRLDKRTRYRAAAGWQAVSLPAEQGVEVVLLLPDGELAGAEPRLAEAALAELLTGGEARPVELHLPRFRLQRRYALTGVLRSLGVTAMFEADTAEFTALFEPGESIRVDSVQHQAVLRLDEHGFEGAAATEAAFRMLSAQVSQEQPLVLRFDRPFLAFVRHRETGAIYFSARVTDIR
jgi:serpin B